MFARSAVATHSHYASRLSTVISPSPVVKSVAEKVTLKMSPSTAPPPSRIASTLLICSVRFAG